MERSSDDSTSSKTNCRSHCGHSKTSGNIALDCSGIHILTSAFGARSIDALPRDVAQALLPVRRADKSVCATHHTLIAGRSFNGRTAGSGPANRGSNPCLPATVFLSLRESLVSGKRLAELDVPF